MEEAWKAVMADFDAVWGRVQGRETAPPAEAAGDEAARLRRFLGAEREASVSYDAMAKLCPEGDGDALRGMARACERHVRRLRTELFLLTGEMWQSGRISVPCDGCLGHLRRGYLREGELAAAYLAASAGAETATLRELYADLSAAASRRRETLFGMARRILH